MNINILKTSAAFLVLPIMPFVSGDEVTDTTINIQTQTTVVTNVKESSVVINSVKYQFSELGKPRAIDSYWDKMAQCETASNWKDKGNWAGGLGIALSTWEGYGGFEFAKRPNFATRDEQIIVANRISTQGYQTKLFRTLKDKLENKPFFRPAVGFGGWGCLKNVGNPMLFSKPPYRIYFSKFKIGESGQRVRILQHLIGAKYVDGYYGPVTQKLHKQYVKKNKHRIIAEYEKYKQWSQG